MYLERTSLQQEGVIGISVSFSEMSLVLKGRQVQTKQWLN